MSELLTASRHQTVEPEAQETTTPVFVSGLPGRMTTREGSQGEVFTMSDVIRERREVA